MGIKDLSKLIADVAPLAIKENEIKNLKLSKDQEISELKNQLELSKSEVSIRESKSLRSENSSINDSDNYFQSNRNSLEFNPVHIKAEIPDVEHSSLPVHSEPPVKKVKLEKDY